MDERGDRGGGGGHCRVSAGVLGEQELPEQSTWGAAALKLFALWCLAFLPGWMYVRFLGMRAKALWSEFVLILHRLGWDRPWHLPEPPRTSDSTPAGPGTMPGLAEGQHLPAEVRGYYGRQVTSGASVRASRARANARGGDGADGDYVVSTESLFPVFLATAVLAAGWAAVSGTPASSRRRGGLGHAKYGFLGAYAFVTGMLVRRFFQSDLRPSAYTTAVLRIVLVLLVVAVLHQAARVDPGRGRRRGHCRVPHRLLPAGRPSGAAAGGVPAVPRRRAPLTPRVPLDQLDGLNLWYEARLTEEGVEDMQNLTTMNLVDVILHTRVPPGRLVDWLDQAFLLIHLDRAIGLTSAGFGRIGQGRIRRAGRSARVALRRVGIRTATDLLKVFSTEETDGGRVCSVGSPCLLTSASRRCRRISSGCWSAC